MTVATFEASPRSAPSARNRIAGKRPQAPVNADDAPRTEDPDRAGCRYRPWAELVKRTFSLDVLECDKCHGRLRLLAMVTDYKSIARFLRKLGEPTEPPPRLPARGPPYWKSRALRRMAGDIAVA